MKKIYIAGPDVFEQDSLEIGKGLVSLCERYGCFGLYPLDNVVDFSQRKHKIAHDIFRANISMIHEADIVIANLNTFRGKEADSGTVWECGYAVALGKKVYGYMDKTEPYIEQFTQVEKSLCGQNIVDAQGRIIEDFDHPINLMIACSLTKIVAGGFKDALEFALLDE